MIATNSLEYIEMFYCDVSFIIRDIGNNGFFVSYGKSYGKSKHAYVNKSDIIEYMLRYSDEYSNMTMLDRKRKKKLISLQIMSE